MKRQIDKLLPGRLQTEAGKRLEQYRKANLNEPAKYIKIFDNGSGYLKFDNRAMRFIIGDKSTISGWYQVKFKRSDIDPKLYDIFGTNK